MAGIKHTKGVLDLTFMDIGSEEALTENLRSALTTQIKSPSKTSTLGGASMDLSGGQTGKGNNTMGGGAPQSPSTSPKKPREPELVKAVRLSNNLLENMEHMNSPFMATVDTSNILWLDLSFNKFVNVSEAMAQTFPNITTIYLHANNISRLSQLRKLRSFPNLKSLSLYGNPVEEHKHYRNYVLSMCPHVTQFDSSPVTSTERKRAVVWSNTFRKVLNREDDDENY